MCQASNYVWGAGSVWLLPCWWPFATSFGAWQSRRKMLCYGVCNRCRPKSWMFLASPHLIAAAVLLLDIVFAGLLQELKYAGEPACGLLVWDLRGLIEPDAHSMEWIAGHCQDQAGVFNHSRRFTYENMKLFNRKLIKYVWATAAGTRNVAANATASVTSFLQKMYHSISESMPTGWLVCTFRHVFLQPYLRFLGSLGL